MRFAFIALLLVSSCQKGDDKRAAPPSPSGPTATATATAPGDADYRADVERICGVLSLSGADQRPEGERMAATAQWLGANLETDAGREFMIAFKSAPKPAEALRAEAERLGLAGCALADSW